MEENNAAPHADLVAADPRLRTIHYDPDLKGISMNAIRAILVASLMLCGSAARSEDPTGSPAGPALSSTSVLSVFPPAVRLTSALDRQAFVAQVTLENGLTRDVTSSVAIEVGNPQLVRVEGNSLVPITDGSTEVRFAVDGLTCAVPVTIEQAGITPHTSFAMDVMPIFMRAGCNSGSCHGAARGKDGFRLSLFGFDPAGDYHRLTREIAGRRVNLALPESSLLVEKATGQVAHTGGDRIKSGDPYHAAILQWIRSGSPADPGEVPSVVGLEVYPPLAVLNGADEKQQLTVRAVYADGNDRDVTSLAVFLTSNDNSAAVDPQGLITAKNRGEAFVMARFDTHTVGIPCIVLPRDVAFEWKEVAEANYVDTLVHAKLKKLRIQPSEVCSDEVFIRRVYLDICGAVPTPGDVTSFVQNPDPEKRRQLIDQLLERPEYVEMWVMKWSELLTIRSNPQVSYKAALLYFNWLRQQIADNVRVDEMIKNLLGSTGGTFSQPATNYYQTEQDSLKVAENVAQVFLGMRIQCAQCHNHPFDRWKMDDYYGFAAFFSQIGRKRGEDPRETIVFNSGGGEVSHFLTKQPVKPKFLGGESPDTAGKDRRAILAEWLVRPENPYFSKNMVNIVWAHFLGRGIVDPVDDVRVSNPPSNQALLDELAKRFAAGGYDFKQLIRDICNSRTYQLSTQVNDTNATDERNFSHAVLRRLRAEVMLDVISQVTETKNKFRGLPLGARATQIADGNTTNYFLTTFGRARRETVCSCEVKTEPNLGQALHLLNGETLHGKIAQGQVVASQLQAGKAPLDVVDDLYLRCLGRRPTDAEREQLNPLIEQDEDKARALNDIFWALLNSQEFMFCH